MAGGVCPLYDHQAQPLLSGRCSFFRALHLGIQFSLHPGWPLFGTQQQGTHPLVTSSLLSFKKMAVFQGVAPWHKNFTLSCAIPLWDSATAHSASGKELIPSSLEESCLRAYLVTVLLKWRLWHRYFSVNFAKFLRKHLFSRTSLGDCFYLLLCNALILSCLCSISFGTRLFTQ